MWVFAFALGVIAATFIGRAFATHTVTKVHTVPGPTVHATVTHDVPGPTKTVPGQLPAICKTYITTLDRMYGQFTVFIGAYGSVPDELKDAVVNIQLGDVKAINQVLGDLKPMNEAAVQAEVLLQTWAQQAAHEKAQCDAATR